MTQRTLVLLKPDAVRRGLVGEVLSRFEAKGLTIVAMEHRTIDGAHWPTSTTPSTSSGTSTRRCATFVTSGPLVVAGARGRRGDRGGPRAQRRHRRAQGRPRHHPRRPVALEPREPRARLRLARSRPSARSRSGSRTSDISGPLYGMPGVGRATSSATATSRAADPHRAEVASNDSEDRCCNDRAASSTDVGRRGRIRPSHRGGARCATSEHPGDQGLPNAKESAPCTNTRSRSATGRAASIANATQPINSNGPPTATTMTGR